MHIKNRWRERVCVWVWVCVWERERECVCVSEREYAGMYIYIYTYMSVCLYICMHLYLCMCVRNIWVHLNVCMWWYVIANTHTYSTNSTSSHLPSLLGWLLSLFLTLLSCLGLKRNAWVRSNETHFITTQVLNGQAEKRSYSPPFPIHTSIFCHIHSSQRFIYIYISSSS